MREWVRQELAEWDKAARLREEALDQRLETIEDELVKQQRPWSNSASGFREKEAAIAQEHKREAIEAHSPVTADVLRSCGIDLVKEKTPTDQVPSDGDRLQITLDELVVLFRTPTDKLKDFTLLLDARKADTLWTENPALYRVIRELAIREMASKMR